MPMSAEVLSGTSLVAGHEASPGARTFRAVAPSTGEPIARTFFSATPREVDEAARAAASAMPSWSAISGAARADVLDAIAAELDALGEDLVALTAEETGLPGTRLRGELGRTSGQFRHFATALRSDLQLDVILDPATAGRPDLRRIMVPVGPVAVFGASNFPLAFSTPGGDTAAALAAGCSVVVKGHPAHPATSELTARAILAALSAAGAAPGVFSLLQGDGVELGRQLVEHPDVAAVGFTGSSAGGRALFDLASRRPRPIQVHAEMGSLNPVIVTAAAARSRAAELAAALAGSFLLSDGQLCTKPGMVLIPADAAGDRLIADLAANVRAHHPGPLLSPGIEQAYQTGLAELARVLDEDALVCSTGPLAGLAAPAALVVVDAADLAEHAGLLEEHFGPLAVCVRYSSSAELRQVLAELPAGLTATLMAELSDRELVESILPVLVGLAGRVLWNDVPTGVAVTGAMTHGGPFPATTTPHSSVGWTSVRRFLRPVSYQGFPTEFLPAPLRQPVDG